MKEVATIRLAFGKCLVMGSIKPGKLSLKEFSKYQPLTKRAITQLGFFETASPNFNTYFPDVKAEDLQPKDDEFVYPIVRALSEVVVRKSFNPIDFGKPGVLKKSMSLLVGQTVYPNHEAFVGNHLGVIQDVEWQDSYSSSAGKVPAGILAHLKIDGKAHPNIARGLLMDPPSIHSVSSTLTFEWEQSHPNMSRDEFFAKLGSFDKDGNLIRRIATNILHYSELSFVSHGADAFAQVVDEKKKIVNPEYAKKVASLSDDSGKPGIFYFNWDTDYNDFSSLSLNYDIHDTPETIKKDSQQNTVDMKNILTQLTAMLALGMFTLPKDVSAITEENAETVLKHASDEMLANIKLGKEHAAIKLRAETAEAALLPFKDVSKDDLALIPVAKVALQKVRDEALKFYKLAKGEEANADMEKLIANGSFEVAQLHLDQFKGEAEKKYPNTCNSCGSTDIKKGSIKLGKPEDDPKSPTKLSHDETVNLFIKESQSPRTHLIHGAEPK